MSADEVRDRVSLTNLGQPLFKGSGGPSENWWTTRAGGATVVAAYSPRVRPGTPVSFPVAWDQLDRVAPADFTVRTAARLIAETDPWADQMPTPQRLGSELIEEGRTIPVARVQAMHEGKRRARARRS